FKFVAAANGGDWRLQVQWSFRLGWNITGLGANHLDLVGTSKPPRRNSWELGCGEGGGPQTASFPGRSMDDEEHRSLRFDWKFTGWFRPPKINSWD
ncbi:hypothetical protein DVH24_019769, partial [Malus domestica]